MVLKKLSGWWHAAALVVLALGLAASCSDVSTQDDGAASTTATTGGGMSAGGMGGEGGMGGQGPMVFCDLDGRCGSNEHCACHDCWPEPKCNSSANCFADGECAPDEGCFCSDCAAEPECTDYCISCQQYTTTYSDVGALCTDGAPSSADIWQSLRTCACDNACAAECGDSFCNGNGGTLACNDCIAKNCTAQLTACENDIKPFILCNPVTGAPCNVNGGERCDRLYVDDTHVGFWCRLTQANAGICDACEYTFGSDTYCQNGGTCVDVNGVPATFGNCGRYCCDSGDCGSGTCATGPFELATPGVGVCVGGCDAPEDAPSMGSCVTLTPTPMP